MIVHEEFVLLDFVISREVGPIFPVGPVHDVVPTAAGAQILALGGNRKASRSPPLCELGKIRPRIPDERDGRIIQASDVNVVRASGCGHRAISVKCSERFLKQRW